MKKLLLLSILLTGCLSGSKFGGFDFDNHHCDQSTTGPADALVVRYLGTGGVALQWREETLLLGPFFSNPGMLRTYFWGNIRSDEQAIDTALAGVTNVRAIFVGHSHYDHIGDLPEVAHRFPDAKIYVNDSGVNALAAYPLGESYEHGRPIPVGNAFTVTAVKSDHAPQLCAWRHVPCTFAFGPIREPWTTKWPAHNWRDLRLGNPHAFIIELQGTPYRIYYNDSAVAPEVLSHLTGHKPVDLAILTVASFNKVRDYPSALLRTLEPRHVLLSHYENFFRGYGPHIRFAPLLTNEKAATFLKSLEGAMHSPGHGPVNQFCGARNEMWSMPMPGEKLYFVP